jgi:hypothetical protein
MKIKITVQTGTGDKSKMASVEFEIEPLSCVNSQTQFEVNKFTGLLSRVITAMASAENF